MEVDGQGGGSSSSSSSSSSSAKKKSVSPSGSGKKKLSAVDQGLSGFALNQNSAAGSRRNSHGSNANADRASNADITYDGTEDVYDALYNNVDVANIPIS